MDDYDWQEALPGVQTLTRLMNEAYSEGLDAAGDALYQARRDYVLDNFHGATESDLESLISVAERR